MKNILKLPVHLLQVFGAGKSFAQNPILGNARLNAWGLHQWRVAIAARMAERRRKRLGLTLNPSDRAQIGNDGYLIKENYLPDSDFQRLKSEIYGRPYAAREMRQGQTVTRMIPLGANVLQFLPETRNFLNHAQYRDMLRLAASYAGEPAAMIHVIMANPEDNRIDPQTDLHSDTFHATAKAWYFLHDVGPEDGPFCYVPRSHLLTPQRLQWEYERSLTVRSDPRKHHTLGSFRITTGELEHLGYVPVTVAVKANTLVIADTRGFHGRTPSRKPTMRISLDSYLRRNPFLPWTGMDIFSLPLLHGRSVDLYLAWLDFLERNFNKRSIWRNVGEVMVDAPARISK